MSVTAIREEFMRLPPGDWNRITTFYEQFEGYFKAKIPSTHNERLWFAEMMHEVAMAYFSLEDYDKAVPLFQRAMSALESPIVEKERKKELLSMTYHSLAVAYFCRKQYFRTWYYFNKCKPEGEQALRAYAISKRMVQNRLALGALVLGLLILALKYVIRFFFPEHYSLLIDRSGWAGVGLIVLYILLFRPLGKRII